MSDHETINDINITEDEKEVLVTVHKEDKYKLVLILFYTLGVLTYLPQTFYINANNYWMYKFRDPNALNSSESDEKTEMQTNFTSYYTIISNVCFFASLLVTSFIGVRIPFNSRIISTMILLVILFVVTLSFPLVDTDFWQQGFFILSLILGGLISAIGACLLISVFQLANKLSPVYLIAQLAGQSLCGIVSALIQIFALAIGASPENSAVLYFGIGVFYMVLVMICYLISSTKIKFFRELVHQKEVNFKNNPNLNLARVKMILRKLTPILITMVLTAGASIMTHPSVTSLVESTGKGNGEWNDVYFVPVCTFLLYNVIDFIGRECCIRWKKPENGYIMLLFAILRTGLVPLLMLCNAKPRSHLPVVFNEDYIYVIFLLIFAFSSGYLINLCILTIPKVVEASDEKLANVLLVVVMVASLGPCSFLSKALIELL